jgi:hypothetical protein
MMNSNWLPFEPPNYEYFAMKYYIRVFEDNGKLRLQALDEPPKSPEKYEMRECTLYSNLGGTRKIHFYLDGVYVPHEATNATASKIFSAMGWLIAE